MGFGRGKGFTTKVRTEMTKYLVKGGGGKAIALLISLVPTYTLRYGGGKATATLTELSPTYETEVVVEGVEEQTEHDMNLEIRTGYFIRHAQRMTIPNRQVTKLSFILHKKGTGGTGDITFALRKVSDDSVIASKVWGDSGDLTVDDTWYEVELDTPVTVNEEVRQSVEFTGGDANNCPVARAKNADVKADEHLSIYNTGWIAQATRDMAYRYKYVA